MTLCRKKCQCDLGW